jgi:nucleoside-diphosphate-sugar epimerase
MIIIDEKFAALLAGSEEPWDPIGRDPDQRNYIVSNEKIEKTGYKPAYSLDRGIQELLKGFVMIKNSLYGNV